MFNWDRVIEKIKYNKYLLPTTKPSAVDTTEQKIRLSCGLTLWDSEELALGKKGVSRIVVESAQRREDRNDQSHNLKLGITLINYSTYICIYFYLFDRHISDGQLKGHTDIFE